MVEYTKLLKRLVIGFAILTFIVLMVEMDIMRYHLAQEQVLALQHDMDRLELALNAYWDQPEKVDLDVLLQSWLAKNHDVKMTLHFNNADPSVHWYAPPLPTSVPRWFLSLAWFEPVQITKNVEYHWQQRATIELVGATAHAYHHLWVFFQQTALTFTLFVLIGMMLISLVLKQTLRPLEFIASKLSNVSILNSEMSDHTAVKGDLKTITNDVAFLASHVEEMLNIQAQESKKWRNLAYIDPVTQLSNRSYFLKQVGAWIEDGGQGGGIIIRLKSLSQIQEVFGFKAVALQLQSLAWQLQTCEKSSNSILARISEEEFVLVLQNRAEPAVLQKAADLAQQLPLLCPDPIGKTKLSMQIGVIYQQHCDSVEVFLKRLDQALAQSDYEVEKPFTYLPADELPDAIGKCAWHTRVENALADNSLGYRFQSVERLTSEIYHKEIFSYLADGEQHIPAYRYVHALESLKVIDQLDQHMIQLAVQLLTDQKLVCPIAINISMYSMMKRPFIQWLSGFLQTHASVAGQLHFELPEYVFLYAEPQAQQFCQLVRKAGAGFGIDRFGRNFQNLDYVKTYRPDFVKLDPIFTHNVTELSEQVVLASIARIAKQQGILVIASRVESQEQIERLAEYCIDAFQGHIFQEQ